VAGVPENSGRETEACKDKLRGVLRSILFLDEPDSMSQKSLVNGVSEISINGDKPMVNGTSEISGDQFLSYLKRIPCSSS
jgi:hypothetical protein